ncbi:MAG: MAPEG family protein [Robiginitomaculum sp.]
MTLFQILGLYVALLLIINMVLMVRVFRIRQSKRVSLGDGDDPLLHSRIRAHANFSETVPIALFGLFSLAMLGAPVWALHLVGAGTVIGRISHAIGMAGPHSVGKARPFGIVLFLATSLFTALYILGYLLGFWLAG